MCKHFLVLLFLSFTSIHVNAQLIFGVNMGISANRTSSVTAESFPDDISYRQIADNELGRIFVSLSADILIHKTRLVRQELVYYHSYRTYNIVIPPNNFDVYLPTSFKTLNYRVVTRIMTKNRFTLLAGASFDFNFETETVNSPYSFQDNYPEVVEFANSLLGSYNPVVLYTDIEGEFKFGRFRLSFNYKYGITSPTGNFDYKGIQQGVRSSSHQFFLRTGYDVFIMNKSQRKQTRL